MRKPKRLIFALAGLVIAAGTALGAAAPASAADPPNPLGQISNLGSGKCIAPVAGPDGNVTEWGLGIEQFTCNGSSLQTWIMDPIGTGNVTGGGITINKTLYHIINQATGLCLDDRDGKTSDRSPVQQWPCNGTSTTMQWALFAETDPAQQLINRRAAQNNGSTCLDVAGGSQQDGAVLQLYHCTNPNDAQRYFLP